ncbi:PREDICTED: putative pentatricopeptide repeat-containing protein At1g64310 [Tarenaya hassleriana]|uniref:putative pentatricopeptide repeat-containing protein At1g64310 n=1 Tax=Tarenaya hassleriana TaxID=28532 RepID=UPI00053C9012|nr:PREDICTED: putative pentatricopeptide repeat-containing protein At1g64310 [Tarenaya hassleriana]
MPSLFRVIISEFAKTFQTMVSTEKLQAFVAKTHLARDPFFATKLVRLYTLNGDLHSARKVFDETPQKSVFLWNSIIRAYSQARQMGDAVSLFYEMLGSDTMPDNFTYACLVRGFSESFDSKGLRRVHGGVIVSGLGFDHICGSAVVTAYSKLCLVGEATKVFHSIPDPDVVLWNAMISGYGSCGFWDKGISLFSLMLHLGKRPDFYTMAGLTAGLSNCGLLIIGQSVHGFCLKVNLDYEVHVGSALVSMYSRCKCIDSAYRMFLTVPEPDLVAWSSLITGFSRCMNHKEALFWFSKLNMSCKKKPDCILVACVLGSCAELSNPMQGKEVHGHVLRQGLELDIMVCTSLIDFYSKCGSLDSAINVFAGMAEKNVVSFNAIILGLGLHGFASIAFEKFKDMLEMGIRPDEGTFSALLCTCCHSGLLDKGREFLRIMRNEFGLEPRPEHHVYMVKLLGMEGKLEEAFGFVSSLQEPIDSGIWGALLACCESHGDAHLAEVVAEKLFESDPEKSAYKVMLSNVYARHGRWDEVKILRDGISESKEGKVPGISWV